jgi:Mg-chelatase subunit ChlD
LLFKIEESKMREDLAELVFIVDRSGSMSGIASDMEEAIGSVLAEQKKNHEGEIRVTFVRFDTEYEEVFGNRLIGEIDNDIKIEPRGGTALLDAMGQTINVFKERFLGTDEANRPGKVLFLIITDGCENASVEYTRDKVFEVIEVVKKDYEWGFTFIGANQDAVAEAHSFGISAGDSLNYTTTQVGMRAMSNDVTNYTSQYLSRGTASYSKDIPDTPDKS